jgi:NAD(P)-dependent dehydrogenase (short-subunit alcohol dehydrogenase family)
MAMTLNLRGKTALVTGGARGIGRAIAERLVEAGAAVMICSLHENSVTPAVAAMRERYAANGARIAGRQTDVSKPEEVEALFRHFDAEFGGLDILINNAGIGLFKDLKTMEVEEWRRVIGTNLDGAFYCVHAALRRLCARGGGWVINVASLAAKNAFAGGGAYNASKFGVCGMIEAAMLDHRYEGVKVSSILPGSVNTGFGAGEPAEWKIAPEDVAEAVACVLAMPERTLISHLEIRPSRPPRK